MNQELTSSLLRDHEVILRAVDRLENKVIEWRRTNDIDSPDSLNRFVEFAKHFTDKCHHGKEERCLFPCLERRGIPREGGPIGVMLYEHELGRQLIKSLEKTIETYFQQKTGLEELLDLCEEYINLIRQHIQKENDVLFPMGENVTTQEDRNSMASCYEKIEVNEVGLHQHHKLEKMAEEI